MPVPAFDPTLLPQRAAAAEPAIDPQSLSPAQLRAAFLAPREWQPESNEAERLRATRSEPVAAAVLIPIVLRDEASVLLTQRTEHLNDHAGQISFPGGRAEPGETDPIMTALRETEEEIGLARSHIQTIGQLTDYYTGTGYRIVPIVALVTPPFDLTPDPFEVADVFEVPLVFLMDPANHQLRSLQVGEHERQFYAMPFREHFIWGATAGMLRNLYRFLRAQEQS